MRKLIAIVGLLAISGIVVAQQTRTGVTKATTPADDSKPNSDTASEVYARGGKADAGFPGQRDPWLWPFASNSIWNMPIGSEARYVPAGLKAQGGFDLDVRGQVVLP